MAAIPQVSDQMQVTYQPSALPPQFAYQPVQQPIYQPIHIPVQAPQNPQIIQQTLSVTAVGPQPTTIIQHTGNPISQPASAPTAVAPPPTMSRAQMELETARIKLEIMKAEKQEENEQKHELKMMEKKLESERLAHQHDLIYANSHT